MAPQLVPQESQGGQFPCITLQRKRECMEEYNEASKQSVMSRVNVSSNNTYNF